MLGENLIMQDDDVDKATEYLEQITAYAIEESKAKAKTPINTTGKCIWCDEPVIDNRRWCSVECRNEFARHAKNNK